MRYLLDTHVVVWAMNTPEKLGPATRRLLDNKNNEFLVSVVSTLELACLLHGKKMTFNLPLEPWMDQACQFLNAGRLDLDHAAAREAYALPGDFHRDPGDRLLVATARLNDTHLVTADDLILGYPHVRTVDARK